MTERDEAVPRGPVSEVIESEVTSLLRQHGSVVWYDAGGVFSPWVDALAQRGAGALPYAVVPFRGSFLEVLFALEAAESSRMAVLLHLPRHNSDSVRATPLLEYCKTAYVAPVTLDGLVTLAAAGRVAPPALREFLDRPGLSVSGADEWLKLQLSGERGDAAAFLDQAGPLWALDALVDGVNLEGRSTERGDPVLDERVVREFWHRQVGMDPEWVKAVTSDRGHTGLGHALASWILCVEYVSDLKRPPASEELLRLGSLPTPLIERCKQLCEHLRTRHPRRYISLADLVEADLPDEVSSIRPEDLGRIDTFRFEESRVLEAALQAARAAATEPSPDWSPVLHWARTREHSGSIWLSLDQTRRWAWQLLGDAARLGAALAAAPDPLSGAIDLDQATDAYCQHGAAVDEAHRLFEQRATALLEPRVQYFGQLRELRAELRRAYRGWADRLSERFSDLCRDQGFLPSERLRQRTLFDQVVTAALDARKDDIVAFVLVDALRYEMAVALARQLDVPGTQVDLRARLAELPTITAVGMNALAPLVTASGQLAVARSSDGEIEGFRAGEFAVKAPVDRARAIRNRVGQLVPKWRLSELMELDRPTFEMGRISSRLVLVTSEELDQAGESGLGLRAFDSLLGQLRAAVGHLQSLGVRQVILTADHGFLLQDETTRVVKYGKSTDPQRRHVVAADPRAESGMVAVSLTALGYDPGPGPGYLLFRQDTAVFATGGATASFVHGGNSPAERVIPVLTVTRDRPVGGSLAKYRTEVLPEADVLGLRRVRVRVLPDAGDLSALEFASESVVDVELVATGRPDVYVTLKDATGGGVVKGGRLAVRVGEGWTEVFFGLEGPREEMVALEVVGPGPVAPVAGFFSVSGRAPTSEARSVKSVSAKAVAGAAGEVSPHLWQSAIEDLFHRRVMLHLAEHGSITEVELNDFCASPRLVRQFALRLEDLIKVVPFRVRVEPGESGKRYVRERDERSEDERV
ncbi:MAG: BREX-6 system phosphatase PglZ [Myxococcales bacterium]|nr:BREX-6 system phosphatase PglZ [Myxococcales bacterium]